MNRRRILLIPLLLLFAVLVTLPGQAAPWHSVDDQYTVALLHLNGDDASNAITDESGKAWTAYNNAEIDTAQAVFGGASLLLDGSGDYIGSADSADWRLDGGAVSGPWAIDARVRFANVTGALPIIGQYQDASNFWILERDSTGYLRFYVAQDGSFVVNAHSTGTWLPELDTWYALAVNHTADHVYQLFVDGARMGYEDDTSTIPDYSGPLEIGKVSAVYLNGWIDELRISKGSDRGYTDAGYTPATDEFGAAPPEPATDTPTVTPTFTASPTPTPIGTIGPALYPPQIRYGQIARFECWGILAVVSWIALMVWIMSRLGAKGQPG